MLKHKHAQLAWGREAGSKHRHKMIAVDYMTQMWALDRDRKLKTISIENTKHRTICIVWE